MSTANRLRVLEEEATAEAAPPPPPMPAQTTPTEPSPAVLTIALFVLKALGQRSVAMLNHLLPIIGLSLGFVLWWRIIDNPTPYQLGGLGLYGAFLLLLVLLRR